MNVTEQIKKEYASGTPELKASFERIFGKEPFEEADEAHKMFVGFCNNKGLLPSDFIPYPKPENRDQRRINAFSMLMPMIDDRRKGWVPDFNDSDERKWWPIFDMSDSGFAFAYSYCDWARAGTNGGSRLCLKTEKEADVCGRELLPLWREFLGR